MPSTFCLLYITTADHEEAESIARALLEARLIACANLLPGMVSFYRWEGMIRQSSECVLLVKTTQALAEKVTDTVKSLHSYDCPCVVALPVEGGNAAFLSWIEGEVKAPA